MIPDFAMAMLSKEPPSAAKCSSPIVVMTDAASSELEIIFVASRAPPNPACYIQNILKLVLELSSFNFVLGYEKQPV